MGDIVGDDRLTEAGGDGTGQDQGREHGARTNRRHFLGTGVRTGAALTVGGAVAATPSVAAAQNNRPAPVPNPLREARPARGEAKPGPATDLWVNGLHHGVGIDPDDLSFSWRLHDPRRGAAQTAYRIVLWQEPNGGGRDAKVPPASSHWDSGWVTSTRQAFIPFPEREEGFKSATILENSTAPGNTAISASRATKPLQADTRYRWTVATKDHKGAESPWASPSTFTVGLRLKDWTASWLSPGPITPTPEQYAYLRATVKPSARRITRATAYVAAAHKYHLYVNGAMVDTGPCFAFPDESYVQATDVTDQIRAGAKNAIGLLHHWYGPGNGRPKAQPAALLQLTVHHEDGTKEIFGTDETWKERKAEWLPAPPRNTEAYDFIEIIDARQAPLTWSTPKYNDSEWQPVRILGPVGTAPFTDLYAQRTRIQEHVIRPTHIHRLPSGDVVLDFGKVYAARPVVDFHNGAAGRTVSIIVGYALDSDGSVSTTHATQGTDLSFSYIQRDGGQTFAAYTYLGWRYLQISGAEEVIDTDQVIALARHAGMPEGTLPDMPAATFTTSNKTLDRVWDLCVHSALYASHEQFVDTPTRQKGQFVLDSVNEAQAIMHAFGDRNMSWQCIRDHARGQARFWPGGQINELYPDGQGATTIPDFTEVYSDFLWRYLAATGDAATAIAYLPVVEKIVGYVSAAITPSTGLVTNLPGGGPTYTDGIVDWPPQMRYGYDRTTAARTTVNVLAANMFTRASALAAIAGNAIGAAAHAARAQALTAAINARLVGPTGVYIDGLKADGSQSIHASQQANALALCYGIVPTASVAAVGAHVASLGIACGPDLGLDLVRGLHAAGLDGQVVDILTNPKGPGWANILAQGGTFCWESWTPNDLEEDSMSHGWGSGVLAGMVESILGLTHASPTNASSGPTLRVQPPAAGVSHAAGSLPTIAGMVKIAWTRRQSTLQVVLTLPPNTQAAVVLPASSAQSVTESGVPVTNVPGLTFQGFSNGRCTLLAGGGTYAFKSQLST